MRLKYTLDAYLNISLLFTIPEVNNENIKLSQ